MPLMKLRVDDAVSYEPFVLFMVPMRAPEWVKGRLGSKATEAHSAEDRGT